MKVVHLNKHDTNGGAAVAVRRLNTALNRTGVESHMLVERNTSGDPNVVGLSDRWWKRAGDWAYFGLERLDIYPHERAESMRYNFSTAAYGHDVSKHPLVIDADIIHLHWINQGFLSFDCLGKLAALGKPIFWTLHDMWPFTGGCHYAGSCLEFNEHCGFCPLLKDPGRNDLSTDGFKLRRDLYNKANLTVVSCSQWLNSLASSAPLFRGAKCMHIPNAIDTNVFRPLDKREARQQLGLDPNRKYVLFGAYKVTDVRKGFRFLQEALRIVKTSFPLLAKQLEVLVFGAYNEQEAGIEQGYRVHNFNFVRSSEQLVRLYNAADMFVLPSLQDNLPNTVVESLACGTPVVGFRTGGVPEMILHERTGYLAEVKNSLSLVQGIYEMMFFDQGRARDRVVAYARAMYGERVVAGRYIQAYEEALGHT